MKNIRTILILSFLAGGLLSWYFLGKQNVFSTEIGTAYLGEDAGYTQLILYKNGILERQYGGIMGITDRKYYGFSFRVNEIEIQTREKIYNLENMEINIEGVEYKFSTLEAK